MRLVASEFGIAALVTAEAAWMAFYPVLLYVVCDWSLLPHGRSSQHHWARS